MEERKKTIDQINSSLLFKLGTSYREIMKEAEFNNLSENFQNEVAFYLYLASKYYKNIDSIKIIESELENNENMATQYVLNKLNNFYRIYAELQKYTEKIIQIKLSTLIDKDIVVKIENEKINSSMLIGQKFTEISTKALINYFYTMSSLDDLNTYIGERYAVLPVFDESEIKENIQSHLIDFNDKHPYIKKIGVVKKNQRPSLIIFEKLYARKMFILSSYLIY